MLSEVLEKQRINLLPGEIAIARKGEKLWTVLGSCVAVLFYNKRTRTSAMCHAQLPTKAFETDKTNGFTPSSHPIDSMYNKYVSYAIKSMLQSFRKLGISNNEIEVHLYGGANMLGLNNDRPRIGEQNIAMARHILLSNRLYIITEDIGGTRTRAVTHLSDSGLTKVITI